MEYTFNRRHRMDESKAGQNTTQAWDSINTQLKETLDGILEGRYTEAELASYIKQAIRDGEPLPRDPEMIFWEFDAPASMPADARCDYVYLPTYLMVLSMAAAVNRYPALMDISGIRDTLSRGLNACARRGLSGPGFESMSHLLKNVRLFIRAGIRQFLKAHPETNPKFAEMLEGIITGIRTEYESGRHIFDFDQDFREEQRETLEVCDAG